MAEQVTGATIDELRSLIKSEEVANVTALLRRPSKENPQADGYLIYATMKDASKRVLIASTSKQPRYIKNPNTLNTTLKDLGVDEYTVDESKS